MAWRNTGSVYGLFARILHWSMGVLIITMLAVGLYMEDLPNSPDKFELYGLHKSIGVLLLALVIIRFTWRQKNPIPALPHEMPNIIKLGAHVTHGMLYTLMLLMPLIGWGMSSAGGHPVSFFGWFTLPPLVAPDKELGSQLAFLHYAGGILLITLILAHVSAAIYHHFIRKDHVLKRMLIG